MYIECRGHEERNLLQSIALLFYPLSRFEMDLDQNIDQRRVISVLSISNTEASAYTGVTDGDCFSEYEVKSPLSDDNDYSDIIGKSFYIALSNLLGYKSPWGTLTGIRPVRYVKNMMDKGMNPEEIKKYLNETFLVTENKADLCIDIAKREDKLLKLNDDKSFSLYISIPFCPSRCNYCSFVSHSIEKAKGIIPEYIKMLCKEIELWGELINNLNLKLKTIYIGGGTPTTLTPDELRIIMSTIKKNFHFSSLLEYTVEAGRPDTITDEKLLAIKECGGDRISINPQTLKDKTLELIGRHHSSYDFIEAFNRAKMIGFKTINTDLIAGLPGENANDFKESLDKVISLSPENITVHTLSIKRAAFFKEGGEDILKDMSETIHKKLDYATEALKQAGYNPYYLYKQKNTVGNFENTGYAKEGHEGLYNIFIMGEYQTIIAAGAGGVTKIVDLSSNRIERLFNYKYPYEYINNFTKTEENIKSAANLLRRGKTDVN